MEYLGEDIHILYLHKDNWSNLNVTLLYIKMILYEM